MKYKFTATFSEWFGRSIIWALVILFTMGIGLIWVQYDFIKWVVTHIEMDIPEPKTGTSSIGATKKTH